MRTTVSTILWFIFSCSGLLAADFDTCRVLLNAKLNIIPFSQCSVDSFFLQKVIRSDCKYRFLESKGFGDIVFFEVDINRSNIDSFSQYMTEGLNLYHYTYCFGYKQNIDQLMLLRGFFSNDFRMLYNFASTVYAYAGDCETKSGFCKTHFVEGLDLECLYEYHFLKKKKLTTISKYECMKPNKVISTIAW